MFSIYVFMYMYSFVFDYWRCLRAGRYAWAYLGFCRVCPGRGDLWDRVLVILVYFLCEIECAQMCIRMGSDWSVCENLDSDWSVREKLASDWLRFVTRIPQLSHV